MKAPHSTSSWVSAAVLSYSLYTKSSGCVCGAIAARQQLSLRRKDREDYPG